MNVVFASANLDRLETDAAFDAGFGRPVVRGFRKVMQQIRAARTEQDLKASRGLRFEYLKGDRKGQISMRLNDQFRLIVEMEGKGESKRMKIVEIVDYH